MNGMVMISFLKDVMGRAIMISEGGISQIIQKWKFEWGNDVDEFRFFIEDKLALLSSEIKTVEERYGILILYKYEKNVKIEIEIL